MLPCNVVHWYVMLRSVECRDVMVCSIVLLCVVRCVAV